MSQVWALVPVKRFVQAKSRLARTLSLEDRRSLVLAMAKDVTTALMQSKAISRVVLVSDVSGLDRLLGIDGAWHFDTTKGQGLNEDLTAAAAWAGREGATHVLIAHADLPMITPAAVNHLVASAKNGSYAKVRIAACKKGRGSNVLLAPVPLPFPLLFGDDSLFLFSQAAAEIGISVDVVHDFSLAMDIDEPLDFCRLVATCNRGGFVGCATADFIRSAGLADMGFLSDTHIEMTINARVALGTSPPSA